MKASVSMVGLVLGLGVSLIAEAGPLPRSERTQFVLVSMDTTPGPSRRPEDQGFYRMFQTINRRRAADASPNSFTLFINLGGFQFDPRSRSLSAEQERYRACCLAINR
jgi:hypothetical protein